jgi:hypothetical protein
MSNIVLNRYKVKPAEMWGIVLSVNYAMQSIGSLAVAPMIKRWSTQKVLSTAIFTFGIMVAIIPILEGVTGGGSTGFGNEKSYVGGNWSPLFVAVLFPCLGFFQGVVELIRRIIPRDIVGADPIKLKKMDSTVHIFYEVAGTVGALLSKYWISYFNYGYSLAIIPICFTPAAVMWSRLRLSKDEPTQDHDGDMEQLNGSSTDRTTPNTSDIKAETCAIFKAFFYSVWVGAKLVCSSRALIWLIPAYSLPLVLHRYLENVVFAHYANYALSKGSYQQLLVGGSNLGELLGAFFVLVFSSAVPTPIPWLRLDALTLLLVWILPCVTPFANLDLWVWMLSGIMVMLSFGWASGDVSLVAYVQARLADMEDTDTVTSPLAAVMAFLYVIYIVMFAIVNVVVSSIMDSYAKELLAKFPGVLPREWPPLSGLKETQSALFYTAGVTMTVCCVIVLAATFIPRGSFAFNPKQIEEEDSTEIELSGTLKNASDKSGIEKDGKDRRKDLIEAFVA